MTRTLVHRLRISVDHPACLAADRRRSAPPRQRDFGGGAVVLAGSLALLAACSSDRAKPPASETATTTKPGPGPAPHPAVDAAPTTAGTCGDGKITYDMSMDSGKSQTVFTAFCRNDGRPALQQAERYQGNRAGKPVVSSLTMAAWTQLWQLAEAAQWRTATTACAGNADERTDEFHFAKDGVKKSVVCFDKALSPAFKALADQLAAVDEASSPVATPPAAVGGAGSIENVLGLDGPEAPATLDPTVAARFAVVTSAGRLEVYRVADGKVALEANPEVGGHVVSWVWKSASEIVLLMENLTLQQLVAGKLTALRSPPKKLYKRSGNVFDEPVARFEGSGTGLVATATGEVWIQHCIERDEGDEDPCSAWGYVRATGTPVAASTAAPTPRGAPPALAGTSYRFAVTGNGNDPGGGTDRTGSLTCTPPGGAAVVIAPPDDASGFAETTVRLSARPPIQLVTQRDPGADNWSETPRFLLGCKLVGDADPSVSAERGPSGLWTASEPGSTDAAIVAWHGRVIATVTGRSVKFAP